MALLSTLEPFPDPPRHPLGYKDVSISDELITALFLEHSNRKARDPTADAVAGIDPTPATG